MDYRKLKNAAPAKLSEAGEAWKSLLDEFDKVISDFRAQVCDQLDNGDFWRGEAKELATAHGKRIHKRMREYRDRIAPVSEALNTAAEEITTCQRQVRGVADEVNGRGGNWRFDANGEITYPEGQRSEYESYVAEIEGILSRAAEADQEAARALSEADDTLEYLNEVLTEERREEEQAAKEAAELASQSPDELSFAEGKKLAQLLRENGKDPAFAGEFLERVQPKQLLKLTDHLQDMPLGNWDSHTQESGPSRSELISSLQRRLGETLATGTGEEGREYLGEDLHGPEEEGSTDQRAASYGKRMLKAAENWDTGFLGLGSHEDTGYRALGMLLHSGEYSRDFLNPVGDGLVEADKKDAFEPLRGNDINHVDDRGRGGDPLVGLMTALEHSPDAAGSFFDPARNDENLGHLVQREWPVDRYDHAEGPRHDSSPTEQEENLGHDLLGKALESATLGEQHGSAEAARTVSGMVHTLANTDDSMQDPGQGTIPPPLRDSVGHMLSNYMGAVHDAGPPSPNDGDSLGMSGDNPNWATGAAGDMNPRFSQSEVYKVMGSAAYDPNAYAEMRDANMVHTELRLDSIAANDSIPLEERRGEMEEKASKASSVFGALDEARSYAVDEFYDGEDAAFNSKIDAGGTLTSWAVTGASAAWSGPGGAALGTAGADAVDQVAEQLKQDSSNVVTRETADLQGKGQNDANSLLNQTLWENRMWKEGEPPPPELFPGESSQRIIDSNGRMSETYQEWVGSRDPYDLREHTVQNAYHTGADVYADATGNRPVRVSETE
ncbi:DUF6571 family protein [Actinopolyspora saharensis]|uniref:Uncharacterized protein n=1 Tax=Actinopolyspora saharensis TaxID=995062 RepID=A0A1H1ELE7_9ACTN|nr:DUF6571 family protein [Actinopolyspora saharensis]SDQ89575.1 hypothetical protein SAMN04489718_2593 [Actinopolyspora saharensis]